MDKSPELWAFILANTGIFVFSSVMTVLCYLAYRRSRGQRSYRFATAGFGFVLLGGLVEPAYQLGVRGDYHLDGSEMLLLQSGEGAFISLGLGLLFYAITQHDPEYASTEDRALTGEDIDRRSDQWDAE